MLKTLLKKQFLELNSSIFNDVKKKSRRSKAGIVGFILLFAFVFLSIGFAFFAMAMLFAGSFIPLGMDWLMFSLLGTIAVFAGSFLNMFIAKNKLYNSNDNELLLAMPIAPSKLLFSRMLGLYLWGLLYEGVVFIPLCIAYWIEKPGAHVLMPILAFIASSFLMLTLSCLFGWVLALIGNRLKNKAVITTLITLALMIAYYVFYFRLTSILQSATEHAEGIAAFYRSKLAPLYLLGRGATGDIGSLALFALISIVLFVIAYAVIARGFVRIVTSNRGTKKAVYKEKTAKQSGVKFAIVKKELKHFISSPAYLLNMGLGLIVLPAAGIFAMIKGEAARQIIDAFASSFPEMKMLVPAAICASGILIISMNCITAPSISLEGKTIWLSKSLPLEVKDIFEAKELTDIILNTLPVLVFAVSACIGLGSGKYVLPVTLCCLSYMLASAAFGLVMNMKHCNLNWTSETAPVKQSLSTAAALFGGWAVAIVFGAAAYFLRKYVGAYALLGAFSVVFAALFIMLNKWLRSKGCALFEEL